MSLDSNICNKINFLDSRLLKQNKTIFMDYNSTTPVDPRVVDVMMTSLTQNFGNPHSRSHAFGWKAEEEIELNRQKVAQVINASSQEIIFTSGATESNNLAIKGVAKFYKSDKKNHIITMSTEHKCVIESCRFLQENGFEVTFLKPEEDGILDLEKLKKAIKPSTILVSVMSVNHEIGVIQNLKEIGAICRQNGVFFHTDCAQGFGKIKIDVEEMNIDLLSISAHKIYGPKGIGALYIRRKPKVKLQPLFSGGGQEKGLRSGTLPTFLIAGLGTAAELMVSEYQKDFEHISFLTNKLKTEVMSIPEVILNGSETKRYYGNLNFSFLFIEGESLLMSMNDIAVSSGSACTSSSLEPSYVLKSLGLKDEVAHSSVRFCLGRFSTLSEVEKTVDIIKKSVDKLRDLSPLWEMHLDGIDIDSIKWNEH